MAGGIKEVAHMGTSGGKPQAKYNRPIRICPQRLENLENENGHEKVMEHEKLNKSHGIL